MLVHIISNTIFLLIVYENLDIFKRLQNKIHGVVSSEVKEEYQEILEFLQFHHLFLYLIHLFVKKELTQTEHIPYNSKTKQK